MELLNRCGEERVMAELIYYLQTEDRKKKFAVVKYFPQVVDRKFYRTITSGNFEFAISDESEYLNVMNKISEILSRFVDEETKKLIMYELDDVIRDIFEGFTFHLTVEQALYLSKLIVKFIEEDNNIMRELRANLMFEESFKQEEDPSVL